jgi:Spy/CpxP family protein refolding chaperone
MEQRRRTQLASLRAILTPEQQARFDGNVAELAERMRDRGDRRGRGGPWHGRGA